MWQRISADDSLLVQDAFRVLAIYHWVSDIQQLLDALDEQAVYFYRGKYYELVGSFRYHAKEREWRIEMASIVGVFSRDAAERSAEQIVAFMKAQNTKSLSMITVKRDPSEPIEVMYRALGDAVRQHPAVLDVKSEPSGLDTRWSFILK